METGLPHKLRTLRVRQGLTLVEASKKTGVTRATLSELERGHRHPVAPTLVKIAEGYGVPVEELLEEPVLSGKAEAPLPLEIDDAPQRGYLPLSRLLEDWRYLIESTAERHIQNASSSLFETVEGAHAYSVAAYIETAQLFEIYLERLSPTIYSALPEALAELEAGKLNRAIFRLEEAQEAIVKAAKAAGASLDHEQELSEEEKALIEEATKEHESLSELDRRRRDKEAWEIVARLAESRVENARELTEEVRNRSSA